MRLEKITLTHVRVPLREPFAISGGAIVDTDAIVVRVHGDGVVGYGQSSPMAAGFGYSSDTPESCWNALTNSLVPRVLGRNFQSADQLDAALNELPGEPFAKAGIETAFWDLLARAAGQPLARLLGGGERPIPCGLVVGVQGSLATVNIWLERHLGAGYRRVKLKIRRGQDHEVVASVRRAFPDVALQVDANAGYTARDLEDLVGLDAYGLQLIEQPFAADALEDHARLQGRMTTPICLDESLPDVAALHRAVDLGSLRVANVKIQRVGGLHRAREMHDACVRHRVAAWVGCMPELGIGMAHGLALAALPGMVLPTDVQPTTPYFTDDIIEPRLTMTSSGNINLPDGPGIGFALDEQRVARYRVREARFRMRAIG